MNTAAMHVKKAIAELSAVSVHLKRRGKKSEVVSMCLTYAHALFEFLYTGYNNVHKGRLGNRRYYYSASNIEWMLIEETKNPRVIQFVHRMEAYLTPELRLEFYSSELRRKQRQIYILTSRLKEAELNLMKATVLGKQRAGGVLCPMK